MFLRCVIYVISFFLLFYCRDGYSRAFRKRSPKMPRFGGRLRGVEPEGSLPITGLTHLIRRIFIAYIFQVTIRAASSTMLSLKVSRKL